ncbi:ComEC/Rec2 family competence protein [Ulvibacterium marinum]|uniref:ComEC/Rec2 family competence protein n=1 Tax=Ulvibacterium marinum TaxID=2419782 RepID=UPI002493D434|nr:ComEC/Rec2 family competence protein [Ulvibacterium marinum]
MRLLQFVPIKLTLSLVVGILLGSYINFGLLYAMVTALSLFLLTLLSYLFLDKKRNDSVFFGILVMLTTIGIGILAISYSESKNRPDHYTHTNFQGDHKFYVKVKEVLKPTAFTNRYLAALQTMDTEKASGKILLVFQRDSTKQELKVDDELILISHLYPIGPPLNPHQFNYKKYMEGLGVYHQLKSSYGSFVLMENPSTTLYGTAAQLRNSILFKLQKTDFGEEELSIIQALLLGQRNDISESVYNNYKNAGAVHILAVSGLHIGILLLLLQFVLKPLERLPKGKTFKLAVMVVLLWGFAFLAGLSASVVRAVTMFSFVAYALYLNRPSNTFNILALSILFILLVIDPKLLFQVGFQMSYAAVFAIVWIYPLLQRLWFPKNSLLRKVWQLFSVSIAAQLGVLPISLFYFHQFPGLFFVSNLLIVPFLGLILGSGILIIFLVLLNVLPDFLVEIYNELIGWMNSIIELIAHQEAFIFTDIPFDSVQLFLSYLIIASLVLILSQPTFKRIVAFFSAIILFQSWLFYSVWQSREQEVLFLAHQTRNSILLHQMGTNLNVITKDSSRTTRLVKNFQVAERIKKIEYKELRDNYVIQKQKLWVLDSLGVYPSHEMSPEFVVLTQSPKINLERFIDSVKPKVIIADGNNYKSSIAKWKMTCEKKKVPFHYTGERGAYYFDFISER